VNFFGGNGISIEGRPIEELEGADSRPALSQRQRMRLERDRDRGYSINVKQIVLAFAVEFVIIGLILVNNFATVAQLPDATNFNFFFFQSRWRWSNSLAYPWQWQSERRILGT
jgi:hypothetical protein